MFDLDVNCKCKSEVRVSVLVLCVLLYKILIFGGSVGVRSTLKKTCLCRLLLVPTGKTIDQYSKRAQFVGAFFN